MLTTEDNQEPPEGFEQRRFEELIDEMHTSIGEQAVAEVKAERMRARTWDYSDEKIAEISRQHREAETRSREALEAVIAFHKALLERPEPPPTASPPSSS